MKPRKLTQAEFVTKGAITRLALMFDADRDKRFTGGEVAEILIRSWQAYEGGQDTAVGRAIRATAGEKVLERVEGSK